MNLLENHKSEKSYWFQIPLNFVINFLLLQWKCYYFLLQTRKTRGRWTFWRVVVQFLTLISICLLLEVNAYTSGICLLGFKLFHLLWHDKIYIHLIWFLKWAYWCKSFTSIHDWAVRFVTDLLCWYVSGKLINFEHQDYQNVFGTFKFVQMMILEVRVAASCRSVAPGLQKTVVHPNFSNRELKNCSYVVPTLISI